MQGARISYRADGGNASGYLARPQAGENGKGVIVLQEWWGLVPHIERVTDRLAKEGYVALAPDLWDGKRATAPAEAERLYLALDLAATAAKLRGAVMALREQGGVRGGLGIVGFCMGGQLALHAAATMPDDIAACVDFYGVHPRVKCDFARLRAPILGIFGEKDRSVNAEAVKKLRTAVEAAGGAIEVHTYPAGHAFFNDDRPEVFDAACAADAWRRTVAFFGKHL